MKWVANGGRLEPGMRICIPRVLLRDSSTKARRGVAPRKRRKELLGMRRSMLQNVMVRQRTTLRLVSTSVINYNMTMSTYHGVSHIALHSGEVLF